jgi:hypothetical protein
MLGFLSCYWRGDERETGSKDLRYAKMCNVEYRCETVRKSRSQQRDLNQCCVHVIEDQTPMVMAIYRACLEPT